MSVNPFSVTYYMAPTHKIVQINMIRSLISYLCVGLFWFIFVTSENTGARSKKSGYPDFET